MITCHENLISQFFPYKDHFDPAFDAASSGNDGLAADAVIAQAVTAFSSQGTWRIFVQTQAVWR